MIRLRYLQVAHVHRTRAPRVTPRNTRGQCVGQTTNNEVNKRAFCVSVSSRCLIVYSQPPRLHIVHKRIMFLQTRNLSTLKCCSPLFPTSTWTSNSTRCQQPRGSESLALEPCLNGHSDHLVRASLLTPLPRSSWRVPQLKILLKVLNQRCAGRPRQSSSSLRGLRS